MIAEEPIRIIVIIRKEKSSESDYREAGRSKRIGRKVYVPSLERREVKNERRFAESEDENGFPAPLLLGYSYVSKSHRKTINYHSICLS